MDAGVLDVALASWGDASVVAIIKNDGVLGETRGFKIVENFSDLGIEVRNDVVIMGNIATDAGEIRKVGAQRHLRGIEASLAFLFFARK